MRTTLGHLFSLRQDQDDPEAIDVEIRGGAQPMGANLWVLFFAILIASVGLNVNSTAVIIGAMLISPLMAPILAIGYGAAVQDFKLIRQAFRTLVIFTAISLLTSVLYFTLSPLDQPGSELLARTTPTLWDVLIAAFGGAAGMVAATRKDATNVLPGVAIATALMPPLCTVGFGITHGRWDMATGAFYLFVINGVFIAASTLAISKVLGLPLRGEANAATLRLHRIVIVVGIAAVVAPSIWLGIRFVHQEVFNSGAQRVIAQIGKNPDFKVVLHEIDAPSRTLRLTLIGSFDEDKLKTIAMAMLAREGLGDGHVELVSAGTSKEEIDSIRTQVKKRIDDALVQQMQVSDAKLQELGAEVQRLKQRPATPALPDTVALSEEVRAQYPQAQAVAWAVGTRATVGSALVEDTSIVLVQVSRPLSDEQHGNLQRWLGVRLANPHVQLVVQNLHPLASAAKRLNG